MQLLTINMFNFRYAYAQFPCCKITGDLLYKPFWQAVFRLESMGFKVKNPSSHHI